ncbi:MULTISPECIES: hypothetical protein [unclassified Candidatus Frackibacter]|uniref:hypothetical protein n=1 Tax=unclassified Candidatus Frackibacter TaxID=2648818 RepID=UPI00088D8BD9|nr:MULTISPECIES: hypothetical protein [unclassified Candidatus Frackibacter]SDC37357.1 hypothetical protein SAMN04515661_10838 [Candidatus Frackibacter sp. WG11]SEM62721.1 hypothetical protein SAMN04488698_10951 [Candidatus Frackibacter sp. WG12]SFL65057.1 hypothetical protein SAMN04488699_10839 [Candidatus Frackibacter sp. WG13]
MFKGLSRLISKVHFGHELVNLISFFIGMLASSAMVSFIIYGAYEWAFLSGLFGWLGFSVLFSRYEKTIYRKITLKLLRNYDHDKVRDVLKIIREQ